MSLKQVVSGNVAFAGDTHKEIFSKYLVATVSTMADLDRVLLPYELLEKLQRLIDTIPADEFEGCLDDAQAQI